MQTILIPITTNFFSRNFFRTDAYRLLKAESDIRMVFLVPAERIKYYSSEFGHERSVFAPLKDSSGVLSEQLFKFLEVSSIHTRTATYQQMTELTRDGAQAGIVKRLPIFLFQRLFWAFGMFRIWRALIRFVYGAFPSAEYGDVFKNYRPDLVFCPTLLYAENLFLKEAKRRDIRTAGLVHSWDNFYSKAILRVHPDILLVHTDSIRDQAVRFGDFPKERIRVIGIPQYDMFFRREGIMPRNEFFRRIGGNPSKKLILYAFSGKAGLTIDFEMLAVLSKIKSELGGGVEVLIRPYPRFDLSEEKLDEVRKRYGFLGERALYHVGTGKQSWEFDDDSLSFLSSSMYHADVVINLYSTFFVESALFGKPLIAPAFDISPRNYWNSARRFFEWEHLDDIRRHGAIRFARSPEELSGYIRTALSGNSGNVLTLDSLIQKEVQYTDGKSGERLAHTLLELLR